jgi:uncharacterized membrane protein
MIIEEAVLINADIKKIWELFSNLNTWPGWNSVLRNIDNHKECRIESIGSFQCRISLFSIPINFKVVIEEVLPLKKIVWRSSKFGIYSRHEFLFEDLGENVKVASIETLNGPSIKISGPLFPGWKIKGLTKKMLEDLKVAAENG